VVVAPPSSSGCSHGMAVCPFPASACEVIKKGENGGGEAETYTFSSSKQ
jgi:hypothetical protein